MALTVIKTIIIIPCLLIEFHNFQSDFTHSFSYPLLRASTEVFPVEIENPSEIQINFKTYVLDIYYV